MHRKKIEKFKTKNSVRSTDSWIKMRLDLKSDTCYEVFDNNLPFYEQIMFFVLLSKNDLSLETLKELTQLNYRVVAFIPDSKETSSQTLEKYLKYYLSKLPNQSNNTHFITSSVFMSQFNHLNETFRFQTSYMIAFDALEDELRQLLLSSKTPLIINFNQTNIHDFQSFNQHFSMYLDRIVVCIMSSSPMVYTASKIKALDDIIRYISLFSKKLSTGDST